MPNIYVKGTHLGTFENTTVYNKEGRLSKLLSDVVPAEVDEKFDYDLVVIGGGSGGLACSKVLQQHFF